LDKDKRHHVKFRTQNKKKINKKWIATISIITFFIAMLLGYVSLIYMEILSLFGAIVILLVIVFLGVFFDLLGIAVTAVSDISFNAMATSKVRGARESIIIIRNAGAVANFFNDVIGDISGIISGSASAAILIKINKQLSFQSIITSLVLTGIIAALTVGGKAIGKELALKHCNYIVYRIGLVMSIFKVLSRKGSK
jgi:CBS domain containing-hemolysin-like protein